MVVYDSGLLKVIEGINEYPMGDRISIIKEALEYIDGKIHDIYKYINDLEDKLNEVIGKLPK